MYVKVGANGEQVPFFEGGGLKMIERITANRTLRIEDSGKTFLIATDGLVITLPPTFMGGDYTFINDGVAGNNIITIQPQATDGIAGVITLASTVVTRVGTINSPLTNTKATSVKGNSVRLLSTGTAGTGAYYIKDSTGIWA